MFVSHTKSSMPVMKSYRIAPNEKSRKGNKNLLRMAQTHRFNSFQKVDRYFT